MEDSGEEQYEHDPIVALKHAIMTVSIDKKDNKPSENHYYEATLYKLRRNGITSANKFILIYDDNKSSINLRLRSCGFMQMFLGTLEQI